MLVRVLDPSLPRFGAGTENATLQSNVLDDTMACSVLPFKVWSFPCKIYPPNEHGYGNGWVSCSVYLYVQTRSNHQLDLTRLHEIILFPNIEHLPHFMVPSTCKSSTNHGFWGVFDIREKGWMLVYTVYTIFPTFFITFVWCFHHVLLNKYPHVWNGWLNYQSATGSCEFGLPVFLVCH